MNTLQTRYLSMPRDDRDQNMINLEAVAKQSVTNQAYVKLFSFISDCLHMHCATVRVDNNSGLNKVSLLQGGKEKKIVLVV